MRARLSSLILFIVLIYPSLSFAQTILADEEFSDWLDVEPTYSDELGDDGSSGIDFEIIKLFNDDKFIYMYLKFDNEFDIQEDNSIAMYIDIDADETTGILLNGIGYELKYNFGNRSGEISSSGTEISSYDLGLVGAPTVTSKEFELVIKRFNSIDLDLQFDADSMSILFVDESTNGDQLPEVGEILTYALDSTSTFQEQAYDFYKPSSSDIRVISYNTERGSLFDNGKTERYARVLSALNPDIIGFQEASTSSSQLKQRMELLIPSTENEQWYTSSVGNDNVIASRYPILKSTSVDANAAYLIDYLGQEVFIIAAHPPCCANENGRQNEIDSFMAYLRDSMNGENWALEENTPIIILGDMNLVGLKRQQTTLITGDILDNQTHGPDFAPDWDGTSLNDSKPITVGLPNVFTWYSESSSFGAGRLDYIVYSGSVLELDNSFTLHTPNLDAEIRIEEQISTNDTIVMSDHVPVVADFSFKINVSNEEKPEPVPSNFELLQNFPNPFNPTTNIPFELKNSEDITIELYDIKGQLIETLFSGRKSAGRHQLTWKAINMASGIYFYSLISGSAVITRSMILLK